MTSLTVSLINSGRDDDLLRCVEVLAQHETSVALDVIVVATATPGEVRERVEQLVPCSAWVEVERFGVASMRNEALNRAQGELLLFLDTDTQLLPRALDELCLAFARYPKLAVAGAKLINPDGSLQHSARRFYTLRSMLLRRIPGERAANSASVRSHLLADWNHDDERIVDWVVGACFAMRTAAAARIGPFVEDSPFGFEDVDWCYRAHRSGFEVRYIPGAVAVHAWKRSSHGINRAALHHANAAFRFWLRNRSGVRLKPPRPSPVSPNDQDLIAVDEELMPRRHACLEQSPELIRNATEARV